VPVSHSTAITLETATTSGKIVYILGLSVPDSYRRLQITAAAISIQSNPWHKSRTSTTLRPFWNQKRCT